MRLMKHGVTIRNLYTPIQPTVKNTTTSVSYTEFKPASELQEIIYCYWQLKTVSPLQEDYNHLVVADGCIDIYFELNSPHKSFVMGFCDHATQFMLGKSFNYVGIRFLPTMFPQLFKTSAESVQNRFELLDNVVPRISGFIADGIHKELNMDTIRIILDNYFGRLVSSTVFTYDSRLYNSICTVLRNYGVVTAGKDLDNGISQRQLRRIFAFYIGDTVKSFSNVVRFQSLLNTKPTRDRLREEKLYLEFGYYDQSHFIKEFKNFYGVTPSKAFAT